MRCTRIRPGADCDERLNVLENNQSVNSDSDVVTRPRFGPPSNVLVVLRRLTIRPELRGAVILRC